MKSMGSKTERGSSLVEVMVALFVLAIGLLGILAMQSTSMRFNQSAYSYSQAVYLANDMAEKIRANFAQANNYGGPIPNEGTNCEATTCNAADLITWDKYEWNERVLEALPLGEAAIEAEPAGAPTHLRITVSFDDSRVDERTPGEGDYTGRQAYVLVVGL